MGTMSQVVSTPPKKSNAVALLRNRRGLGFVALTLLIAAVVLFPIASLVLMAVGGMAPPATGVAARGAAVPKVKA